MNPPRLNHIPTREALIDWPRVRAMALKDPVVLTCHNNPTLVIMGYAHYTALTTKPPRRDSIVRPATAEEALRAQQVNPFERRGVKKP